MIQRPAAFLDRDGVLNRDLGYLSRIEELDWVPGAPEAVRLLKQSGYLVFVVTNQSGIARGFYSEATMHRLHQAMNQELGRIGAQIDAFYHCPHHPEGKVPEFSIVCACRKPAPGLILAALAAWPVDLAASFLIGDKPSDLEAAAAAGLPEARLFHAGENLAEVIARRLGQRSVTAGLT